MASGLVTLWPRPGKMIKHALPKDLTHLLHLLYKTSLHGLSQCLVRWALVLSFSQVSKLKLREGKPTCPRLHSWEVAGLEFCFLSLRGHSTPAVLDSQ